MATIRKMSSSSKLADFGAGVGFRGAGFAGAVLLSRCFGTNSTSATVPTSRPVVAVSRLDMHIAQGDKQRGSLGQVLLQAPGLFAPKRCRYPLRRFVAVFAFLAVVVCQRKRCDLFAARRVADFCIPAKAGNS